MLISRKRLIAVDKRVYYILLVLAFFLAVGVRLYPLRTYALWGSDNGEYYYLSEQLYNEGKIDAASYPGWGKTYPYFPGMFIVVSWFAKAFGLSLLNSLVYSVPIVSSLSVIILYLIAMEIFRDRRVAILSSFSLAVVVAHAFITSHSMPGSLADPLMLGCILLLLKSYDDRRYLPFLYITTVALIVTHHLSSYFLMISLLIGIAPREIIQPRWSKKLAIDAPYVLFLVSATFLFWFVFTNFPQHVLSTVAEGVPSYAYIFLAYFGILALSMLVYLLKGRLFRKLSYPSSVELSRRYLVIVIILLAVLAFIALTSVPGTNIKVSMSSILWFLPALLLLVFFITGTKIVHFYENGNFVYGWVVAVALSLLLGAVTQSHTLIPYRHAQYIAPPLILLSSLGIVKLHDLLSVRKKGVLTIFVCALLVLTAATAYPPSEAMGGFDEGITRADLEAAVWMNENLPKGVTVATDHRLSSTIFGFAKLMCSLDSAYEILHADRTEDALSQLRSCDTPVGMRRIDYVVIDNVMRDKGVALLQWENAQPMSKEAFNKFLDAPFEMVYDNGEVWVFRVNWS
jgi:hypothetical protein